MLDTGMGVCYKQTCRWQQVGSVRDRFGFQQGFVPKGGYAQWHEER